MMRAQTDSSRSWMVRSSRGRNGPSPTMISSRATPLPAARSITVRQARSRVDRPFWGISRATAMQRDAYAGGSLERSEALDVDRRGQPQQSPARPG